MNPPPRITETEWEIMRVIWARHPIPANQIIEQLQALDPTWHPKTTRALLARLVTKGALHSRIVGRVHFYEPLLSERDAIATASESFLERTFGGSLKPMLAFFVEQRKIPRAELAELKRLLDREPPKAPKKGAPKS